MAQINVDNLTFSYEGSFDNVFENVSFSIDTDWKLGFVGRNGKGKTTFLNLLLGKYQYTGVISTSTVFDYFPYQIAEAQLQLPAAEFLEELKTQCELWRVICELEQLELEAGVCETVSGLVVSYINQDTSMLKGGISAFCREKNLDESLFCAILRQLDMERVQFQKNMEDYSEGQKKKVLIAASLLTPAHLYIWDEPLNYIDVFSRMQLEKLILDYRPTMLFVEHDVRFREKIATKTINL